MKEGGKSKEKRRDREKSEKSSRVDKRSPKKK
jgi:hypothetical protein